jgi:hypothetical protein
LNHGQTVWGKKKDDSGNMMGTYWELFKTRKIPSPPPLSNPKRKKTCIRLNVEPFH